MAGMQKTQNVEGDETRQTGTGLLTQTATISEKPQCSPNWSVSSQDHHLKSILHPITPKVIFPKTQIY